MRQQDSTQGLVSNGHNPGSDTSAPRKAAASLNGHVPAVNGSGTSYTNGNSRRPGLEDRPYRGHDREEVTRILIQGLKDMGYDSAATSLSTESGYELESPIVASFRKSVSDGDWDTAEQILLGTPTNDRGELVNPRAQLRDGLVLADGADKNQMLFWLRQQKFMELLADRELIQALNVLREELTPLNYDTRQLHQLSSLLMSAPEDLYSQAKWPASKDDSRADLLRTLTKCIAPSIMIRDHRLAELLDQVKEAQINRCIYHNTSVSPSLYCDHLCSREIFPSKQWKILDDHADEVYHVQFSPDGKKLATGGKDKTCIIYDAATFTVVHKLTQHDEAVCHIAWSPDGKRLITCSREPRARVWDVASGKLILAVGHNIKENRSITAAAWAPNSTSFVTCCHDPNASICLWSLTATDAQMPVHTWRTGFRVPELVVTADGRRLICNDMHPTGSLYVYSLETHKEEYRYQFTSKITSLSTSRDGRTVLLNLSEGEVQMFDVEHEYTVRKFKGQKQGTNIIRSCFGGAAENFVLSGSEDGRIYIWHKENAALIETLRGHEKGQSNQDCVTTVCFNPSNAGMFASGGDDRKVRIWTSSLVPPSTVDPQFGLGPGRTSVSRSTYRA